MFLKMRTLWFILPISLFCAVQLRADSVTLKTGEKITGTIKDETPAEIVIDVPVSASITDERVIQKTDIAKVDKVQPDEIAYKELAAIQPSAELSYTPQRYSEILGSLEAFQKNFPTSSYLPEIKKLEETFQDEKKRVDAGGVKYRGEWLSKEEAARRSIQIGALQVYDTMQEQATTGDLVGAMQTFATIERNYSTTRSYPSAVALARQVLLRLQQDLAVRAQEVKADQEQIKKTIAFTSEPEKSNLIASAKAEQDRANAVIAASIQSGAKWVPLIPRSQVSIDTLQKVAAGEYQRLSSVTVGTMTQSLEKVDAARAAMDGKDFDGATTLLAQATELWPQDESARYWTTRLKEKMASPTPKPSPVVANAAAVRSTPRPANMVAPTPAPPEKPFYMTISGAISIAAGILILGGLLAAYSQKKARQQLSQ